MCLLLLVHSPSACGLEGTPVCVCARVKVGVCLRFWHFIQRRRVTFSFLRCSCSDCSSWSVIFMNQSWWIVRRELSHKCIIILIVFFILWFPSCSIFISHRERDGTHTVTWGDNPKQGYRQATNGFISLLVIRAYRQISHTEREGEGGRKLSLSAVFAPGVCPTSTPLNPVWQVLRSASLFPVPCFSSNQVLLVL